MAVIGVVLLAVGIVIDLIGGIWLLVKAFQASVWWGLGSIFVPFVSLIFVITHWAEAKRPFFLTLVGLVLILIGAVLGGTGLPHTQPAG